MKLLRGIIIVFLLVVAAFAEAAAQSRIREIRIRPDVFDLTASTSQRLDMNGNPCGLLKVSVQVDNVEFQGNIIGDVVRHGGDYWVYVTNGTKKIRMTSAAFGGVDLLFADWDIPHIQSKTTYNVTVELTEPAAPAAAVKRGYVLFTLTPPTATMVFDGQQLEVTDGAAYRRVPYGSYSYTVQAVGYEPFSGTVTVSAEKTEVPVKLRSNKARVTVTAETAGSTIYVDGAMKGKAPWQGELSPGNYVIEARREGYRPREVSVTLSAATERSITIPALEMITGELTVEYLPIGSQVTLDGTAVGTTPLSLPAVAAGDYILTISHSGYDTATLSVTVSENGTAPVTGTLKKTAAAVTTPQPATPAELRFSTKPVDMALCAKGQDGYVYITADQWKKLSESQKSSFTPCGVYLADGNFIVELHDKENGEWMTWNAAMKYNLPTKEQGQILVDNRTALNNALRAFGGTVMDNVYWTKTEKSHSLAWGVYMYNGYVSGSNKTYALRVRAVAPVPESSAR
ncbi:MAG: PEGA domain-containing protein [Bacteroidales bacterium]|nr:PEGA domain-containing protein [Bacteroidales bacterium]